MGWHHSLRFKIVLLIMISMVAMGMVFSYLSYREAHQAIQRQTLEATKVFNDILQNQIHIRGKDQSLVLESLANDRAIIAAFSAQDRKLLADLTVPFFKNRMLPHYGIDQFQFHLPPATSFLRVHKPEQFGDDLSSFRKTVLAANQTQKPVIGLEVGRAGPGLRVVYPLFQGGKLLGSAELGGSLEEILSVARDITKLEFAIGIKESIFTAAKRFADNQSDIVVGDTIYYSFSSPDIRGLAAIATQTTAEPLPQSDGKRWIASRFPLNDFSDQEIGSILVLNDVTMLLAEARNHALQKIFLIMTMIVAVSFGIVALLQRLVLKPVNAIVRTTALLAQGNLTISMDPNKQGEFGVLNRAMDTMVTYLRRLVTGIVGHSNELTKSATHLNQVANDLSSGAEELRNKGAKVNAISDHLNRNMTEVEEAVHAMSGYMTEVLTSAQNINQNMATISAAAEEAAASLDAVANASGKQSEGMSQVRGASERSSKNIATVAESVAQMNVSLTGVKDRCAAAAAESDLAHQEVEANGAVMARLAQSAQEIMKVVGLIRDIAEQTNMLALNAAIEAAGAGDSGKGFAVVAMEVKELARQTGDATNQIQDKIVQIQDQTKSVNDAMLGMNQWVTRIRNTNSYILDAMVEQSNSVTDITQSMEEVAKETEAVSHLVGEMTLEVSEVSRSVSEIALGISEVTRNVSSASTGVDEMTHSVENTSAHGEKINHAVAETVFKAMELTHNMGEVHQEADKMVTISTSVTELAQASKNIANLLDQELRQFQV
ncbi:MAG: HAMP domain-containing protein [Nitrospirae bacterium]|nr:HAMP domain-containing protein [Magnetococcales bacterium]HAT48732.1 hypothetical protein [Alphaproteobacteria bacterium]